MEPQNLGHFVIVDPTAGTVSEKVGGEIVHVLYPKDIKQLKAAGQWPEEFTDKKEEKQDSDEEDEDDDLFVNNNRPVLSETESSEDEEDED
ncbi:hypothetical protein G6F35_017079 [Rhizopus arrhizus]|nr:hypothetical protein G6F35_017079 [Rhizopus arrhizus]